MSAAISNLDLSVLPPEYRAVFEAQQAQIAALSTDNSALVVSNKRLEMLIKELRHALYGKRSEKLSADERQLAFEDLEAAVAEAEAAQESSPAMPAASRKRRKPINRNLGNLPKDLPWIEKVIEPKSLECPCGCGRMHQIPYRGLQANPCRAAGEDL